MSGRLIDWLKFFVADSDISFNGAITTRVCLSTYTRWSRSRSLEVPAAFKSVTAYSILLHDSSYLTSQLEQRHLSCWIGDTFPRQHQQAATPRVNLTEVTINNSQSEADQHPSPVSSTSESRSTFPAPKSSNYHHNHARISRHQRAKKLQGRHRNKNHQTNISGANGPGSGLSNLP